MNLIRVCLLMFVVVSMSGCDSAVSGVSEAEANMSSEEYGAMIDAEESQQSQQS